MDAEKEKEKRNGTTSPWAKLTVNSALLFANKPTDNVVGFYKLNVFEQRQNRVGEKEEKKLSHLPSSELRFCSDCLLINY